MEKQNRTCGECAEFFRCMSESGEILGRKARGDECKAVKEAPACEDFTEAVRESRSGAAIVAKIRDLAHEAQHRGEASELIIAALELCEEYEQTARILESAGKIIDEASAILETITQ